MEGVKYIAPYKDMSGYGEASRNYILSLYKAGVPITIESRRFETNPPLIGTPEERQILASLENKDIPFETVIVHMTPDLAPQYKFANPDKRVINYTVWETSNIHPHWTDSCNNMDEIWVPCEWNVEGFRNSGVRVPIYKIPHGISPDFFDDVKAEDINFPGVDRDKTFIFYSIFQWNFRKNPDALLRSYFAAFGPEDDVLLVIKTYVGSGRSVEEESNQIKEVIQRIKNDLGLSYYPKIRLVTNPLSTLQVKALHKLGHCYVILPRGEGWGLTTFEAGLAGTPVISTGMGGHMEFMNENNSYPVDFMETYVSGMGNFNRWYLGNQTWAEPSVIDAAKKMRQVYSNYGIAKEKALLLQKRIKEEFSWDRVAKLMIDRINGV